MDINRENYESWFLDYIEGSLTAGQISQVHHFVSENPDLQKEFSEWKQTLLKPDLTVVFHDKEQLKRRRRILPIGWVQGLGAVAAVGLLVFLALPLLRQNGTETPPAPVAVVIPPVANPISGEGLTTPAQPLNDSQSAEQLSEQLSEQPDTTAQNERLAMATRSTPSAAPDLATPEPVQPRAAHSLVDAAGVGDLLAQASERPAVEAASGSVALEPGFFRDKINDRLPVDIGSLLTTTQTVAQNATRSIAGFMSGESEWLTVASRQSAPEAQRTTEPMEEARVFRFSVGGFKVYHRKTPKTDS
ncbi:MAG: hypothetical protein GC205_05755 [Bacteroidetes bacterium]|nr:hypothetical protein [Bacteroidota bacterium]